MDKSVYKTDEGTYLSLEDDIFYIKWKVKELLNEGWEIDSIIGFREDEVWIKYSILSLGIKIETI